MGAAVLEGGAGPVGCKCGAGVRPEVCSASSSHLICLPVGFGKARTMRSRSRSMGQGRAVVEFEGDACFFIEVQQRVRQAEAKLATRDGEERKGGLTDRHTWSLQHSPQIHNEARRRCTCAVGAHLHSQCCQDTCKTRPGPLPAENDPTAINPRLSVTVRACDSNQCVFKSRPAFTCVCRYNGWPQVCNTSQMQPPLLQLQISVSILNR